MADIRGNNSNNDLYGTDEDDRIVGLGGDDYLTGGFGGADKLFGGGGNDRISFSHYDATDIDRMYGGDGVDAAYLWLGGETQDIVAQVGVSTVKVGGAHVLYLDSIEQFYDFELGSGNDRLVGGALSEFGYGNGGNDRLIGNGGADFLYGMSGDDVLFGNDDNDKLDGGGGGDALLGGGGDDTLVGGADIDRLTGGQGHDQLTGDAGHDRFIWQSPDEGGDRITDFTPGQDLLLFASASFGGIAAVNDTNFVANSSGVAKDADDRFLFSTGTKGLFFDADGNGAGAKVLIAHIDFVDPTHAVLNPSDFHLF